MAATNKQTRWLDAAQQRSWRTFLLGSTRLLERLERELRERHGLSLAEYEILVRLSESPERRLRMAELATSVSHSRSRVTHTVIRLEAAGLVTRRSCPTDGRGVVAQLTDDGWQRLVDAAPTHVEGVRAHLVDLVDDADLEATGRVFAAVAEQLDPQCARAEALASEATVSRG